MIRWTLGLWISATGKAAAAAVGDQSPLARDTSAPVLREPSVQEHWSFLRDYKEVPFADFQPSKGANITRVRNLDDATFKQFIRDGIPFVVDDCTHGFDEASISKFECKDFADRWPSGNMRAEYTPGQYHIYLKDPNWYSKVEPQKMHPEHMAGKQKIAGPYIWHVKDEEPLKTKREAQQHWRTPYFLEPSIANRMEANESFEFWFSMAGGGTFTHADAYCESTISMQFKGRKRWRIQAFPEIKHYFNASAYGDEQIYDNKQSVPWTPEAEFTVEPGQCFVFPTGYLHETFVDPAENEQGCFTASTFQFNHPRQVNLYRAFLSRFSMSHYGMTEPCLHGIESYVTLLSQKKKTGKPDAAKARSEAERIVKALDADGDSLVTQKELYEYFCKDKQSRKRVMEGGGFYYNWNKMLKPDQRKDLEEEAMNVWTEDALQYHDLNKDKSISVDELAYNFLHWDVVQHRLASAKKASALKNPEKAFERMLKNEKDILSKHYCEDAAACPALEELSKFGERARKSSKRMRSSVGKVAGMFESEEGGDEETLTMVDRTSGSQNQAKVGDLRRQEL